MTTSDADHTRIIVRERIRRCFGKKYDKNDQYIICIQGSTSSGKSVFAKNLIEFLGENGLKTKYIQLDNYYYKQLNPDQDESNYDYDNPGSLDWDGIFKLVSDIIEKKTLLTYHVYNKNYKDPVKIEKKLNTYANVIIIEGIFSFNVVNEKIFNIKEFNPYDTNKKIANAYVSNPLNFKNTKILKIKMTLCKSKMYSIRLKRDLYRGRIKEEIERRIQTMIIPDTMKWVYSDVYNNYINVVHGNFNKEKAYMLLFEIGMFFAEKPKEHAFALEKDYWNEFSVPCSGECNFISNDSLQLRHD